MPTELDDDLVRILDLDPVDRPPIDALLADPPDGVADAMAVLTSRLGTFPRELPSRDRPAAGARTGDRAAQAWIVAIVRFAPEVIRWHTDHGVPPAITEATLADVGRQFRLHRITHGRFGLESWSWLTLHLAGNLFHLGRLQFALRMSGTGVGWELDVHIPPTGSLTPAAVQDAYGRAVRFFAERFPDRPAGRFVCYSWLLDPYLAGHLPDSNIASFQRGYDLRGDGVPSDDDVLYFVFRTRSGSAALPRITSLQRLVLDRIDGGDHWLAFHGTRPLPAGRSGATSDGAPRD
ncbi:hypothetical protein SAMN04515671_1927 [Nakamurella panacisegetis]|uniref:GNAT-like C-terminal domain-containing protein n=1 Tax=Nakamurella panacisegetis TaxID=1090615 RepID=A0A1H0M5P4_9ACTN|nr:acyltransferase domain-containing protein [Nakamurella panacisegetis]SDO75753.1 hypothetical protein SAMN04515671_1927 [Nakamurella panacisegetis]